jgi:TrmH family RNA methyltransferase
MTAKDNFPIIILLHKINNPKNLGAILRSAEAVGVNKIITTTDSVNAYSTKALRASMGSSLRMQIWENVEFDEVLNWAVENGLLTTCADINSKNSYTKIDWKKPRLLIFGSEAHGLSVEERSKINESLFIPMENQVESLNLAVSCGVILFEAKRQLAN